jgi:hypothetical protein
MKYPHCFCPQAKILVDLAGLDARKDLDMKRHYRL